MKKVKLVEDDYPLVKSHWKGKYKGTLYEYLAGITRAGDDDWVWQGYVVASNQKEAYALLKLFIVDKLAVFRPQEYEGHINEGIKPSVSERPHGVYGI